MAGKGGRVCVSCEKRQPGPAAGPGPFTCGLCLTDPTYAPREKARRKLRKARKTGRQRMVSARSLSHAPAPYDVWNAEEWQASAERGEFTLVSQERGERGGGSMLVDIAVWMDGAADAVYCMRLRTHWPQGRPERGAWAGVHRDALRECADMAAVIQSQTLMRL